MKTTFSILLAAVMSVQCVLSSPMHRVKDRSTHHVYTDSDGMPHYEIHHGDFGGIQYKPEHPHPSLLRTAPFNGGVGYYYDIRENSLPSVQTFPMFGQGPQEIEEMMRHGGGPPQIPYGGGHQMYGGPPQIMAPPTAMYGGQGGYPPQGFPPQGYQGFPPQGHQGYQGYPPQGQYHQGPPPGGMHMNRNERPESSAGGDDDDHWGPERIAAFNAEERRRRDSMCGLGRLC
ncbi:hypothetical protein CBS101457_003223 [Exobasidium rhododendri]|nr:hypothetical protein CBS101457_003223 [Exobasidium rhododendri]